jgi:LCP family protein required for cell wall assembly
VAALLSALWPGLGHLAEGARWTAVALALPPLVLLILAIAALLGPDRVSKLATLLNPDVIAALLVAEFLLLAWRLIAVGDAYRRGKGAARERGAALTAVALVFVLVPSVYAAYLTEVAREAALTVFAPVSQTYAPAPITGMNQDNDFGTAPLPSIQPSPPPTLGRFTVLLLGVDSGPNRSEALTDTMIVASLDPIAGAVSMVSVPRDMVDVPLADGRIFHPKVNSLVSYVNGYPSKFPGAPSGEAVLAAALGRLLNVHIDGWAEVNLPGFVKVIDAIGGVDVTVTDPLCDYRYREYGFNGFAINPGHYHLNGLAALAYARIRHSAGESDFTRAARQGEIVIAARDRIVQGGFLNDPAGLIESMGELVKTNVDPTVVAQYAGFAASIQRDHIYRAVIQYPLVHGAANDPRGSVLIPRMDLIQTLARGAFPEAGTLPVGLDTIPAESTNPTKTKLPSVTCSAPPPTATPTQAPTTKPSNAPTAPPPTQEPTVAPPPTPEPTVAPPIPSS